MIQYEAKDLFQLQADLVDTKVEIAQTKAIDRVIERIDALKTDVHDLRQEMNTRFVAVESRITAVETKLSNRIFGVENRLTAVETKLGMRDQVHDKVKSYAIEYAFKGGWLALATVVSTVFLYFHIHS